MQDRRSLPNYRSSLIYYTYQNNKIYVLLAKSHNLITSIGGRRNTNETSIICCARECYEETKGIIDYRLFPMGIHTDKHINYYGYSFYLKKVEYEIMESIVERFTLKNTEKQEELDELIIFELSELMEMLVNKVPYREIVGEFFLDIGYFILTEQNRVYKTSECNIDCDLYINIEDVPKFFSIIKVVTDKKPFIISKILNDENTYMTFPYYFTKNGRALFKNGYFDIVIE